MGGNRTTDLEKIKNKNSLFKNRSVNVNKRRDDYYSRRCRSTFFLLAAFRMGFASTTFRKRWSLCTVAPNCDVSQSVGSICWNFCIHSWCLQSQYKMATERSEEHQNRSSSHVSHVWYVHLKFQTQCFLL